jgi:hypothetical protein
MYKRMSVEDVNAMMRLLRILNRFKITKIESMRLARVVVDGLTEKYGELLGFDEYV